MAAYLENSDGYIVFYDYGACLGNYGYFEEWFPTYDEATKKALEIVSYAVEKIKENIDEHAVIVYEGKKETLFHSHSNQKKVFYWTNFRR